MKVRSVQGEVELTLVDVENEEPWVEVEVVRLEVEEELVMVAPGTITKEEEMADALVIPILFTAFLTGEDVKKISRRRRRMMRRRMRRRTRRKRRRKWRKRKCIPGSSRRIQIFHFPFSFQ